ncbi:hypothetical protein M406DRAFT_53276 [Cryphonectria parasitica EP155]|uniref:LYR motif-containing protein Cup1-like N-terminal domain-containing protein n=1 Tax=Cryphonectria parasitica (strain ATCC 38755 / EP155) TaxID=660469 RepID=A0A9P4Y546_CRYP1|nr:uncharacterized protein M406DRAFT_53276 [Cryphonectria parasitica EP155]KAF3766703.1 hypothetical protein M406DRAFT_53276 [Cryphonectria parasitica EP155]
MPKSTSPSSSTTLALFRSLLREASYLPPVCRPFVADQIRTRFRAHMHDKSSHKSALTLSRISRARHNLRLLHAANMGHMETMRRVLMLSFGRIGKRRRVLMSRFLAKPPPADSDELARQIREEAEGPQGPGREAPAGGPKQGRQLKRDWLDNWDLPKLHALAASQAKRSFWSPKPSIKGNKLNPQEAIPELNIWGRPLAARLRRSKMRKWYKAQVNRLMPPVGRGEWEMLRHLAAGTADRNLWEMPTRRPQGLPVYQGGRPEEEGYDSKQQSGGGGGKWDWKEFATHPVRHIERGSSRSMKVRTGEQGEAPYGLGAPIGVHSYKRARFWTRLYSKIWEMTPTMTKVEDQPGRWHVEWGRVEKKTPVATANQAAFFKDAIAKRPKKPRRQIAKEK